MTDCSIAGCGRAAIARGWCDRHYRRWKRNGDMDVRRETSGTALSFLRAVLDGPKRQECIAWPFSTNANGYARVYLNGEMRQASRVICEWKYGPPPSADHQAAHSCGKGHTGCVNPEHLRWATVVENHADKIVHGTANKGEKHGNAVLRDDDIRAIRAMRGKATQRAIAAKFDLRQGYVSRILSREIWGHVE